MKCLFLSCFFLGCLTTSVSAQNAEQTSLTGRWVITADFYGTPRYMRMQLEQSGDKLSGNVQGDKLDGSISGSRVHFVAKNDSGGTNEVEATVENGKMTGDVAQKGPDDPVITRFHFTAVLVPPLKRGTPQRHEFTPTVFYRQFSPFNKPVLTIAPGDTVHTWTVDAGGNDAQSVKRIAGGNPETGPFYIEGAMPGDTLVVHLVRLRLNRDWAGSDDAIVDRGLDSDLAVKMKDVGKSVRWHLDTAKGVASPANAGSDLANFTVPLRPMLGCVATAPGTGGAPPPTGDSGGWGGNMDFNEVGEGATLYLPVSNPGALLYVGDGHALQGDGELNGNALETSMDVEFSVDVIQGKRVPSVRVETPSAIIAMGLDGSLDGAFKDATSSMARWLDEDYRLTPSEIAQVLGSSSEYKVSEVADRNAGIVLRINKDRLKGLVRKSGDKQ